MALYSVDNRIVFA